MMWRNFGKSEVIGAILLTILTIFQITLVGKSAEQYLFGYIYSNQEQLYYLCLRHNDTTAVVRKIIKNEASQNNADVLSRLEDYECKWYQPREEFNIKGTAISMSWPTAYRIFDIIQIWWFAIGFLLFAIGIFVNHVLPGLAQPPFNEEKIKNVVRGMKAADEI